MHHHPQKMRGGLKVVDISHVDRARLRPKPWCGIMA
jgi:hypothetical protein